MTETTTWLSQRERGTLLGIRTTFAMARMIGRRPMRPMVSAIAWWYRLRDRRSVQASRDWLTRVHGRPPGFLEVYRHLRTFAQVTLDRMFLLSGGTGAFAFSHSGRELIEAQLATGRGAVLLGAHLGSYEAMCNGGPGNTVPIHILGYFENAKMINALFERLSPERAARVIHFGKDPVGVMARVRARIEAGDLVGILGDRVGLNDRVVRVPFFGSDAAFAAGPFLLASLLRCPVYLVFGLYREPNRYELHCERFADRIELPRKDRERALEQHVRRYAERLEHYCRQAPNNWFNFFDFWRRE